MNKKELIERLLALPKDIEAAEKQVLDMSRTVDEARKQVDVIENDPIMGVYYTRENKAEREARILALTMTKEEVTEAETWLNVSRVGYNKLMNEFRALQAVAGLLSKEDTL